MLLEKPRNPNALPLLVGHRGACAVAPENTMVSFQRAFDDGADIVELDIQLSSDGHVLVMHDARVDRTTNGTGEVSGMTLSALQQLDAGSWFSPEYAGARIPSLAEVCAWAYGKIGLLLEFKHHPYGSFSPDLAQAAVQVIREHRVEEQIAAISYQPLAMKQLKTLLPSVRAGVMPLTTRRLRIAAWLAGRFPVLNNWRPFQTILLQPLHYTQACGTDLVTPNINLASRALVEASHRAGFPVSCGGLHWNYPKAVAMGVDTISSNNPGRVKVQNLT